MPDTTQQLLCIEALEHDLPDLAARYAEASPFPHIVLDDVLQRDVLERVLADVEAVAGRDWTNYLHLNERKFANNAASTWGPDLRAVLEALSSDRFVHFLEELTGFTGLLPDPSLDGGGLHRSVAGGFLNVHADFTAHHSKSHWRRRVNLLLYLNPGWDPAWGGELELWARDMSRCVTAVAPVANRLLIFTTDEHAFHGHPTPLAAPPGTARQSLALYYFTDEEHPVAARATNYRARPEDGARRALIWLDKLALRAYDVAKRRLRLSDGAASRMLGRLSRRRRDR